MLRGINVGSHNQVKMDTLRRLYAELGFADATTYIQSGNVVFRAKEEETDSLTDRISHAIKATFGIDVPVIVKTIEELKSIVHDNPFIKDESKDSAYLHVTFLSATPDGEKFRNIQKGDYSGDELALVGETIYLYCPNGYGRTKLTNTFFEARLRLRATTRNWKTTLELLAMAERL